MSVLPVAVSIPTWHRPGKLAAAIGSVVRQTVRPARLYFTEDHKREFAIGIWNRLAPEVTPEGGAFVYMTDDAELDPGCLQWAWERLIALWPDTDGVIGFNQRNIQGKEGTAQSAMGMIGAKFLARFPGKRPFCPDYSRFHFDSELGLYARSLGRFSFEEPASLVHWHPAHYPEMMDSTHAVVRDRVVVALDQRVWEERRRLDLLWGRDENLIRDVVRSLGS